VHKNGAHRQDSPEAELAPRIVGREDLSKTTGIRVTKLKLSPEALESLNAHVPAVGAVRQG
jgi:hypothetical protein